MLLSAERGRRGSGICSSSGRRGDAGVGKGEKEPGHTFACHIIWQGCQRYSPSWVFWEIITV